MLQEIRKSFVGFLNRSPIIGRPQTRPQIFSRYGGNEGLDPIHQEAQREAAELGNVQEIDSALLNMVIKGSTNISPSFYEGEDVYIKNKRAQDATDTDAFRRAIHTISNYYNSLGIVRDDFDRNLNDLLSRNAYYAIGEKAIEDYFGTAEWTVVDKRTNKPIDEPIDFLTNPNPQESFGDVSKMVIRDLVRYDAGVIVKSFKRSGYLSEIKAYLGTEFWKEQDRVPLIVNIPINGNIDINDRARFGGQAPMYQGWWSHGYTERWWQRSRTGVYIPFQPEEISYFMMYPRSDNIYGTDWIKFLRYQLQYLIDSTKAAGKTFENGIVPSIVWEHPEMRSVPQLRQRIKEAQLNYQGWSNFGTVIHAVNGEKVSSIAQNLHDMQWLEGQKFIAQLIWAMWGFSQDEFLGSGSNRATAYVKRNITKSRMLFPLMNYFEDRVNRTILPFMRGYRKYWKFQYIRDVELDDDQKTAQTGQIKAAIVSHYTSQGVSMEMALKIAGVKLSDEDTQRIVNDVAKFQNLQNMQNQPPEGGGPDGEEPPGDNEAGRYNMSNDYMPINFSDYGQGGEFTETRVGEAAEAEFKKADDGAIIKKAVTGRDGVSRELDFHIYYGKNDVRKAKVYITNPGEAPKGRAVRRGNRGGYYYITADAPEGAKTSNPTASHVKRKKQAHPGWGGTQGGQQESEGSGGGGAGGIGGDVPPPMPVVPDLVGADEQVKIIGKGVGLVIGIVDGKLDGQSNGTKESKQFVEELMSEGIEAPKEVLEAAVELAEQKGLNIE